LSVDIYLSPPRGDARRHSDIGYPAATSHEHPQKGPALQPCALFAAPLEAESSRDMASNSNSSTGYGKIKTNQAILIKNVRTRARSAPCLTAARLFQRRQEQHSSRFPGRYLDRVTAHHQQMET
jgi:hypothetical protein